MLNAFELMLKGNNSSVVYFSLMIGVMGEGKITKKRKKKPTIPPMTICEGFPSTVNIIADDVNEDISFTAFEVLKHSNVN